MRLFFFVSFIYSINILVIADFECLHLLDLNEIWCVGYLRLTKWKTFQKPSKFYNLTYSKVLLSEATCIIWISALSAIFFLIQFSVNEIWLFFYCGVKLKYLYHESNHLALLHQAKEKRAVTSNAHIYNLCSPNCDLFHRLHNKGRFLYP